MEDDHNDINLACPKLSSSLSILQQTRRKTQNHHQRTRNVEHLTNVRKAETLTQTMLMCMLKVLYVKAASITIVPVLEVTEGKM